MNRLTGDEIGFRQFPSVGLYPPLTGDGNTLVFRHRHWADGYLTGTQSVRDTRRWLSALGGSR